MIKESVLKKASEYAKEYVAKNYGTDREYFEEIIKAGKMVYVIKKCTPAATHFYVNYIKNDKILNFPPSYLEILGGFNKDTQLIKDTSCGVSRTLSLHISICQLFGIDYIANQNYTEL